MTRLTTTTALVTLIGSTAALADITADDVWNSFTTHYQSIGLTLEATQSRAGDTLNIENLKLSGIFPFDLGSITITTGGFSMIDNSDGTVSMQMPDSLPIAIALTLPEDIFVTANLDYTVTGYSALASGDVGNFRIDYAMKTMAVTLVSLGIPEMPTDSATGSYRAAGITGTTTYKSGDLLSVSQTSIVELTKVEGQFRDPFDGSVVRFSGTTDAVDVNSEIVIPATGISLLELPKLLRGGLSARSTVSVDSYKNQTTTTLDGQIISDQIDTIDHSEATFSVSKSGVELISAEQGHTVEVTMSLLPFAIRAAATSTTGRLKIPLLSAPDDQNFGMALTVDGLTMNDDIWALFDPASALPRDPANISFDLSGTGKLFFDLLDIDAMTIVIEDGLKFGELTSLALNDLQLSAVGTSLTGAGAFTFDNSDLVTFGGFPRPLGTADLRLTGSYDLMEKLVTMGLLPEDEVMGFQMMLGLFADASEGVDTLTSKIEINEEGHVLANGQRLQ